MNGPPVALVTGGARRIGAALVKALHQAGYRVVIHHRRSGTEAAALAALLNSHRPDSVQVIARDLVNETVEPLIEETHAHWHRLDLLINNASNFYPSPVGDISIGDWDDLMGSNARAPLFLSQAAAAPLEATGGSIVNLLDIHARTPLAGHVLYSMAKAALEMMTRSLALELAPAVRVNAVAPGAILWPEAGISEDDKVALIEATPLGRRGTPEDIAAAVLYLARDAGFVTGQVITVDGGRSLARQPG